VLSLHWEDKNHFPIFGWFHHHSFAQNKREKQGLVEEKEGGDTLHVFIFLSLSFLFLAFKINVVELYLVEFHL